MTATPSDSPEPTTDQEPAAPAPVTDSDGATPAEAPAEAAPVEAPASEAPTTEAPAAEAPAAETPSVDAQTEEAQPVEDAAPAEDATPTEDAAPAEDATPSEAQPADEQTAAEATADAATDEATAAEAPAGEAPSGEAQASGDGADAKPAEKKKKKKKPTGPDPSAIVKRIGATSEAALEYVVNPDPKLARMARKHREAVISEIPPVTAGALLGPDALCRHFLASAAAGRYLDLFHLWELFKLFPEECKPVLASRQKAQEKARKKMQTATHLGLLGSADRVASDIDRAAGLPWRWLKEILEPMGPAIRQRPVVLAAMLRKDPSFEANVPEDPSDRWLAEAAALRESGKDVPEPIDTLLGRFADRLPATLATLSMTHDQYPDRVPALIDRVDLGANDIAAVLAWARDHGHGDQLVGRIAEDVRNAAAENRAEGLARWKSWTSRGVELEMPESLRVPTLEGLDLGRPESADLIKALVDDGADLVPQEILDGVAADNRMLGEKAYEAFVCAGFTDIHLPLVLEGNPMVRPETRCPACQAWTWVRPGHESRCPHDGMPLGSNPEQQAAEAVEAVDAAVSTIDPAGMQVDPPMPKPEVGERPSAPPPPSAPAGAATTNDASPATPEQGQPEQAQPEQAQPEQAQAEQAQAPAEQQPAAPEGS